MVEYFCDLLCEATVHIEGIYMDLPTAERDDAIHRERVYTYELYHQVRRRLDAADLRPVVFSGELDKMGHAIIRRCIPDFVLHVPGVMDSNIAVVEVKPANGTQAGVTKDVDTLSYFTSRDVGYSVGIELVYGGEERDIDRFIATVREANNPDIRLYWHRRPGNRAERLI